MTWFIGFVILAILSFIYESAVKGEKVQRKKDEQEAAANKLREDQIENERIQLLNEHLQIVSESSIARTTKAESKQYLSIDQLYISLLAIAFGVVFIILYFKLIYIN